MVGIGPDGAKSALARVVIVNAHGNVLLDSWVRPTAEVTDYRTAVSGVRPRDLVGAPTLAEVQPRVAALLAGRLLVGHALKNDLKALLLSHPRRLTRDTAAYGPLMRRAPHVGGPSAAARRGRPARLQELAASHLGLEIQSGEHSPLEDARAALLLYQRHAAAWEASLRGGRKGGRRDRAASALNVAATSVEVPLAAQRPAFATQPRATMVRSADAAPQHQPRGALGWTQLVSRAAPPIKQLRPIG